MVGISRFDLRDGIASRTTLVDGERMPVFGLGVWKMARGAETRNAVRAALEAGYRLFDTASLYGNEADVGQAIRESGVPRSDVFVTTKLWNDDQGFDSALHAFERSQRRLAIGEVDLYLIHWPVPGRRLESWRALEKLHAEHKCKSIGVSNFTTEHLDELLKANRATPSVDQVEFSPFLFQRDLLDRCRSLRIQLEAYAPLTRGQRLADATVAGIAADHQRTPAQVVLRWALQHDVVVIPKSARPERIRENADVFGFSLSSAEMDRLDALSRDYHTSWDPTRLP